MGDPPSLAIFGHFETKTCFFFGRKNTALELHKISLITFLDNHPLKNGYPWYKNHLGRISISLSKK